MILDVKKMTPEVYREESRDFQLLCNLYTCIFNGVKGDVDTIPNLLNTQNIMSTMLPLLKTKLGFESNTNFNDDELRYILRVFPYVVRAKGSEWAIKEMISMCLKLYNVSATFKIEKVHDESGSSVISGDITMDSHSILIGIDTVLKSTDLLRELCKYVMPPGFGLQVYFYTDVPVSEQEEYSQYVELIYSSDNINSLVKSWVAVYDPDTLYSEYDRVQYGNLTFMCTHTMTEVMGEWPTNVFSESESYAVGDKVIYEENIYYCTQATTGQWQYDRWILVWSSYYPHQQEEKILDAIQTMFIGSTESEPYDQFKGKVTQLPVTATVGDVVIYQDDTYYYSAYGWRRLSFYGAYLSIPTTIHGEIPENVFPVITIVPSKNSEDLRRFEKSYYRYDATSQSWVKMLYRGSLATSDVYQPKVNHMVASRSGDTRTASYYDGTNWVTLGTYHGAQSEFPENPSNNDYIYISSPRYFMYTGDQTTPWVSCSRLMHTLYYYKTQG